MNAITPMKRAAHSAHSAPLATERKSSPLLAMHKRYEETLAEYDVLEKAEHKNSDQIYGFRLAEAMGTLMQETDTLRLAILYQVPSNWAEAMVLQYHINTMADVLFSFETQQDAETRALKIAIETLSDFMFSEVDQDHGEIGAEFQREATRVFFKRRHRAGVVEV